MAESFLQAIDQALLDAPARGIRRKAWRRSKTRSQSAEPSVAPVDDVSPKTAREERIHNRLLLVFLVLQFLATGLLFVPGTQALRSPIRALPYLSALLPLGYFVTKHVRSFLPTGGGFLIASLLLLVANLTHDTTPLAAGVAQCIFQLAITAPAFWMAKAIRSGHQLERLLVLIFLMNFVSAGLGILQVYYPDRFMPPQFSQQLQDDYLGSLSYVGADGRLITRPPGLSDVPGGAAVAGGVAAMLGLGLSFRARKPWQSVGTIAAAAVGLAVVYLTQVRSVLLMVIGATVVLAVVAARQGRLARASWLITIGGGLIVGSFIWASSIGGATVNDRFLNISDRGALAVYQENRGNFLAETVGELLNEYPLGAGVGRWGMMNSSFSRDDGTSPPPIHVEIQLTGWLLDGGIPMWICYGGAIILAIFGALRLTGARTTDVSELSLIVFALLVFIAGLAWSGPVFNTQLGTLFWTCAAALQGAATAPPEPPDSLKEAFS